MNFDLVIAGVGGQGVLTIAAVLDRAANEAGLYVKQSEVHGMAQRGGAVSAFVRMSDQPVASDLIGHGHASLLLSIEPLEALRTGEEGLEFGGGVLVVLGDGEVQGGFEDGAGGGGVGAEEDFAEENAWHHPVGAGGAAVAVMFDGIGEAAGGFESLGEAETKERVVGLAGDEGGKLCDAVGHGRRCQAGKRVATRAENAVGGRMGRPALSMKTWTVWPEASFSSPRKSS